MPEELTAPGTFSIDGNTVRASFTFADGTTLAFKGTFNPRHGEVTPKCSCSSAALHYPTPSALASKPEIYIEAAVGPDFFLMNIGEDSDVYVIGFLDSMISKEYKSRGIGAWEVR
jgi:hypothetical protein